MSTELCLLAHFQARPERAAELERLLRGLIAPTRKEAGCRQYTLWRHREDPTRFTFVERWESEAALAAHLETPHIADLVSRVDALIAAPIALEKYEELAAS